MVVIKIKLIKPYTIINDIKWSTTMESENNNHSITVSKEGFTLNINISKIFRIKGTVTGN